MTPPQGRLEYVAGLLVQTRDVEGAEGALPPSAPPGTPGYGPRCNSRANEPPPITLAARPPARLRSSRSDVTSQ